MTDWVALTWQVNDATYAAWNAHDADAVAAVFAADARVRDASGDWEIGPDPVRAREQMLRGALPGVRGDRQTLPIAGRSSAERGVRPGGRAAR